MIRTQNRTLIKWSFDENQNKLNINRKSSLQIDKSKS